MADLSASQMEQDISSASEDTMDITRTSGQHDTKPQPNAVYGKKGSTARLSSGATEESGPALNSPPADCRAKPEAEETFARGPISHEESRMQGWKARTNVANDTVQPYDIEKAQAKLQVSDERHITATSSGRVSSQPSGGFLIMQPIDFTKQSEFFAVYKQLAQYFKKASSMNWPLFLALLSSTFCLGKRQHVWIFCALSAFSMTLNVVSLYLAGCVAIKEPSSGDEVDEKVQPRDRYRLHGLCIAAYLSNFSWTATTVSFAVLLGTGYSWFFLILAVLIFPYYFIIKHAMINGITWGVAQYAEHRSDMDFFFGLCFEITHTNFTALAATVFGYLQRNQCVEVDFRAPEIILLVAVVIGLFVMTMCTVPPAAGLPSYRDSFVRRIMKLTVYFLLVLTCSGLFLAVRKICGRYVLLSYIVVVVDVAAYWHEFLQSTIRHIVKVVTRCAEQKGCSGDAESQARAEHAGNSRQISMETSSWRTGHSQKNSQPSPIAAPEQSRLLVTFFSIVSGALMVSYSLNISAKSWKHKASLVMMYSAFVAYLGMVVIMREVPTDKASAVAISSALAGLLLLGALLCFIAFILSNPLALGHG